MSELTRHIDDTYTIDGVDGMYRTHMIRTFNRINFYPGDGKSKFVGSVPGGNYSSPGITACGNPEARKDIEQKILAHAERSGFLA